VTAPRIAAVEGADAAVKNTAAPCQKKVFGVSFVLSVAVFSFTLLGLITTSNWITDHVVIPKMYGQRMAELTKQTTPIQDTPEAAVETTSAN
jgi:hypothetical protein